MNIPQVRVNRVVVGGTMYPPGNAEPISSTVTMYEITCFDPECGYEDVSLNVGEAVSKRSKHLKEKHGQA